MRQTRRKPENRDLLSTSLWDRGGMSPCRKAELNPTIHNTLGNRMPMDSPAATTVPITLCCSRTAAVLESSREPCAVVGKKQRCSPGHSVHDHTNKVNSYLCSPPATATGRWFSNEVTKAFFCHPLSKAMLSSAWEPGVRTVTLHQLLRDSFWMQRGDNISCSLLVFIAFPPPRWQSHCTRLGCHMENMHRDALSAEGNETPATM